MPLQARPAAGTVEDTTGHQTCQHRAHGVWRDEPIHGQSAHSLQKGQPGPITADLAHQHMRSSEAVSVACQRRPMTPDSFRFNV
jgi:hypothetical protein